MKVVILGAGLAGIGAGLALKSAELSMEILEAAPNVGGLAGTDQVDGFLFDRAGHYLHLSDQSHIFETHLQASGVKLDRIERCAGILFEDGIVPYPLQFNLWAIEEPTRSSVLREVEQGNLLPEGSDESYEEMLIRSWGETLCRIFFRPYNEKLWGRALHCLPADCGGRFLPGHDLELVHRGSVVETRCYGYNASFLYPQSGRIGDLAEGLATPLRHHISLDTEAVSIDLNSRKVVTNSGSNYYYDRLISTISLQMLLRMSQHEAVSVPLLDHVDLYNIRVGFSGQVCIPHHWLYIPDPLLTAFRVGFPSNVNPLVCPPGCASISIELNAGNVAFDELQRVALDTLNYLEERGIVRVDQGKVIDVIRLSPAYVIHRSPKRAFFRQLEDELNSQGVFTAGRFGAWDYQSMEESFLCGRHAAYACLTV